MKKSVVSKGRNVKEAVAAARELFENDVHADVDIEIIAAESKGFLGISSRPAVVRLIAKLEEKAKMFIAETEKPEASSEAKGVPQPGLEAEAEQGLAPEPGQEQAVLLVSDASGKVWVKDGRIYCKDAPDKYPIVVPNEGIFFYKNGTRMEKATVIKEEDQLVVETEEKMREPEWDVTLSDDQLEAYLHVVPGYSLRRTLKDREPDYYVELEVSVRKELIPVELEAVMQRLDSLGVKAGLDFESIVRACQSEEEAVFVVARGIHPIPGTHGCFVPFKELEVKNQFKQRTDGTVDFREFQDIPSVERGQVLGLIQPPVQGKPGTSVTGNPVLPEEALPLIVVEGRGVEIVDGIKIVAMEAGQPVMKLDGRYASASIVPILTIPHDVSLKSGNVHYAGGVDVKGSVQDGMLVEAFHGVTIRGNVNMAKICAGHSIHIRHNVITSEIAAGKSNMPAQELNRMLEELLGQLNRMMQAMQQIMSITETKSKAADRNGLAFVINLLCGGKFKTVPRLIIHFCQKIKEEKGTLDKVWPALGEQLVKGFVTPHLSNMNSMKDVQALVKEAGDVYKAYAKDRLDPDCCVSASYVQNSKIYSAGHVEVVGKGVYHSKLYAEGAVRIEGYARGGEIYAGQGIAIREAGSRGGISTRLKVPRNREIIMDRVLEGTVVQIGVRTYTFAQEMEHVTVKLSEGGSSFVFGRSREANGWRVAR